MTNLLKALPLILLLAGSGAVSAEQLPSRTRGLSADSVYQPEAVKIDAYRDGGLTRSAWVEPCNENRDPDFNHHKHEVKVFLPQAKKVAGRLPRKAREAALKRIDEIAKKVGVEIS